MSKNSHQGHHARKRFGQNFLQDQNVIEQIIAAIAPKPEQSLIEIGPGLGALTLPICQYLDQLTVVELDRDLAQRLQNRAELANKLTVIQQDALTVDFHQLARQQNRPLRIFGNLPYNISTPLMFHLFNFANDIDDMFFMLQQEVVNRLAAAPNSKAYGRLSVMAQYYCQIIPVLAVPPHAFIPAPKVDSAVVMLKPYKKPLYPVDDLQILSKITTDAFGQRRKVLSNSLGHLFSSDQLQTLAIDPMLRAENITVQQYCQLANYLSRSHP